MKVNMSRRGFLKSAALTGAAALAACTPAPTAAPTQAPSGVTQAPAKPTAAMPLKGTKIQVLIEGSQYGNLLKERAADFTKLTGIEAQVETVAFAVALQQIETELSSNSDAYDVVQMIYIKTQRWMRPGWFNPLDDLIARDKYDVNDFLPALLDAHKWEGKIYSLPYLAESVQMMYRADKLAEVNMGVPQTFTELEKAMEAMHKPTDFYGLVQRMVPAGVHFPFPAWLQGWGGNIFRDPPKDLTPMLNSKEALAAAENFIGLVKKYSIGGTQILDTPDCQAAMSQGKSGFYLDALGLMSTIRLPDKSKVADKVEISLVPAGPVARVPSIATHGYGIPKASKKKEAAWEFIKWAVSKEVMLDFSANGGWLAPSRKSTLDSKAYGDRHNQGKTQVGKLILDAIALSKCAYRTVPEFPQVGERLGKALGEMLTGQKSVKDALDAAQKDSEKIMTDAGYKISP